MSIEQKAVKEIAKNFESCWNQHDMETFAKLFTEDADFVNVIGMWWKGRVQIKQAHEDSHATMFKNSRLIINDTEVRFLKPDVAIARSTWDLTGHTDPQGGELPPRSGILTNVMIKQIDKWLIISSQNTDIVAMA